MQTLAIERDFLIGIGPLVLGLVIASALVFAVWLGIRVRSRESAPPRPEEQPRLPDGGPVGTVQEEREPAEVPHEGDRLTPHQLKDHGNTGTRPAQRPRHRRRWRPGRSDSTDGGR